MTGSRIVLASASPRRRELLASAGVEVRVEPAEIDESHLPGEEPVPHALRLAREKAQKTAAAGTGRWYLGADTIVVADGDILGKPADADDARRMLRRLSGRRHCVVTAYCLLDAGAGRRHEEAVTTDVFFTELDEGEIDRYVATGCPMDKAGGYAIQGGAAWMVRRIEGSYTNVVGLPLCEVVTVLRQWGAL